jgi:TIGR03009 family protein
MRVAAIVLAVVLIAACPPRRARVVYVVPTGPAPAVPVMPPPTPPGPIPAAKASDSVLDHHLAEWEKKMADVKNVRTEISLKRTDAVFKKEREYTGTALCMKPNLWVIRLDSTGDPTKTDYEAYICDGNSVFGYSGKDKTITQIRLPQKEELDRPWGAKNPVSGMPQGAKGKDANNPKGVMEWFWLTIRARVNDAKEFCELVLGMKARDLKERFDISLFKEDEHYIYLDINPRSAGDKRSFQKMRLALHAPGEKSAERAYLPAQVFVLLPNGDSELWRFTPTHINAPGVAEKNFKFAPIKGWHVQQIPPTAEGETRQK